MKERLAWMMQLKPGAEAAYDEMHRTIWPEMTDMMRRTGIVTFTIFRHERMVFAYQERSKRDRQPPIPPPVLRRWWAAMAPLMECNADNSPVRTELTEVFHFGD